jgi:hypothetical protein
MSQEGSARATPSWIFDAVQSYFNAPENLGFDVIYETAAFQFYGNDRRCQIDITQQALKEDGILKARCFSAQNIAWKKQQMLPSMHNGLLPLDRVLDEAVLRLGVPASYGAAAIPLRLQPAVMATAPATSAAFFSELLPPGKL